MNVISFKDILFQFVILFSLGNIIVLLFYRANTIGAKYFNTQTAFFIGGLLIGILVRLYQWSADGRPFDNSLYLYLLIFVLACAYWLLVNRQFFHLASIMLFLKIAIVFVALYFQAQEVTQNRLSIEVWLYYFHYLNSAILIGSVFTAMMLCHWFFVFHKLPIKYLKRLSHVFTFSLIFKTVLVGIVLWVWRLYLVGDYAHLLSAPLNVIFVVLRFGVGLLIPLFLAFGSEVTIKLPAVHSAIGLLYLAVIFVFAGEVLGQYISLIFQIPF